MARTATKSRGAAKTVPARKQAVAKAAKVVKKTTPAKKTTKVVKKDAAYAKFTTKSDKKAAEPLKKAAKPAKKAKVADESQCSVCMEDLKSKRVLQFIHCNHSFHRTCGIDWLETRDNKDDQVCPLCRQTVEYIKENRKTVKNDHIAQGAKQPCARYIGMLRRLNGIEGDRDDFIKFFEKKTRTEIKAVSAQREDAVKKEMGSEYIDDIDKELTKLTERVKIFDGMFKGAEELTEEDGLLLFTRRDRPDPFVLVEGQMVPLEAVRSGEPLPEAPPRERAPSIFRELFEESSDASSVGSHEDVEYLDEDEEIMDEDEIFIPPQNARCNK